MNHEPRLFRLAVEAGHLHFTHTGGEGWTLTILVRRGDESWDDSTRLIYTHLTTRELLDVICESVTVLL